MKTKKEIIWGKTKSRVDQITDALGKKIDRKIRESVTAMMIFDFSTSASCEGHITKLEKRLLRIKKESRGIPIPNFLEPFIEIYAPAPKNWKNDEKKKKKWTKDNLAQRARIEKILKEFYQKRKTSNDAKLVLENIGIFGAFRIHNKGGGKVGKLPLPKQKEALTIFQKEFRDFAKFSKKKYFSE